MTESIWNGFRRVDFTFQDHNAIIIFPEKANEKRNWMMKMHYFDAFPGFEIEMLRQGWHLVHIENDNRWCTWDGDFDRKKDLADYLIEKYQLAPQSRWDELRRYGCCEIYCQVSAVCSLPLH